MTIICISIDQSVLKYNSQCSAVYHFCFKSILISDIMVKIQIFWEGDKSWPVFLMVFFWLLMSEIWPLTEFNFKTKFCFLCVSEKIHFKFNLGSSFSCFDQKWYVNQSQLHITLWSQWYYGMCSCVHICIWWGLQWSWRLETQCLQEINQRSRKTYWIAHAEWKKM